MGFSNALLTHTQVNVIIWDGTSAGRLGFECHQQLGERVYSVTGIPTRTQAIAQVITTDSTNRPIAPHVAALEVQIGVPNDDPISVIVWNSWVLAGADPTQVQGWGQWLIPEGL